MNLRFTAGTHPVVACLVFVIDPVKGFNWTILDAVLGDPLIGITAALREDAGHHAHLLQVNLDPLVLVVELGEPCTPNNRNECAAETVSFCVFVCGTFTVTWGTYPKPWLLRRALLGIQETYQPAYWSWLEQLTCSSVTSPDSNPRALW